MQIIDIILPAGGSDDFFCPFSGVPAMSEEGLLGESCIAYIPPPVFAEAIISCPRFESFWDSISEGLDRESLEENVSGEQVRDLLVDYKVPQGQMLVGFKVESTTLYPRNAPEFAEKIYTLPVFYVLDFWCRNPAE